MSIKRTLIFAGVVGGAAVVVSHFFLTNEAKANLRVTGKKLVSTAGRLSSMLSASQDAEELKQTKENQAWVASQWNELGL